MKAVAAFARKIAFAMSLTRPLLTSLKPLPVCESALMNRIINFTRVVL